MASDSWTVAASIGQIIAATASVLGLFFVGAQIRASRASADVQVLQEFNRQTIQREEAFLVAESETRKQQAFVELLNFLEIYAAALNGRLLPPVSRKIVGDSIANSVAAIQMAPHWASKFEDAIRTATTFDELGCFIHREKIRIECITQEMRRKFEPSVAP